MFDANSANISQALNLTRRTHIASAIQASLSKGRPQLFEIGGLCPGYPLIPAPDEYFIAHEVSPEKIVDLRHALEQGLANTQLIPYTADQDIRPGHILCKIAAKIMTTAFCIFDLPESPTNPSAANVYLELGIAIGLGRPFVLIKSAKAEPASLLAGLDTFGFSSYSGLRREVGEKIQIGQFSAILPQEDMPPTNTYFLADGEFEQEDFREAIRNALQSYGLQPVTLSEGPVGAELILTQLIRHIQAARFGIYRIDQQASANTFLALGIGIGLNKPWLLVAREGAVIPQDVRSLSNFNFRSFTQLETDFAGRCREFLQKHAMNNPVVSAQQEIYELPASPPSSKDPKLSSQEYNLAVVRQLLLAAFDENGLRQFCFDTPLFRPVYYTFLPEMSRAELVDRILEFSDTHLIVAELLQVVAQHNPRQFARFEANLYL